MRQNAASVARQPVALHHRETSALNMHNEVARSPTYASVLERAGRYAGSIPYFSLSWVAAGAAMKLSSARAACGRSQPGDTPPENTVMV